MRELAQEYGVSYEAVRRVRKVAKYGEEIKAIRRIPGSINPDAVELIA